MTTWFTSDLHIGHRNIIDYCARPFASVAEMDDALVERWNDTVADDDDVWVLGDLALGPIAESLTVVGRLRGRIILLSGNHDRCWPGNGAKAEGWAERYLDAGVAEIRHGQSVARIGTTDVLLCHFPYEGDSHDHDRFVEARPEDRGGWLLHGHVHERWRQRGRMINVGVDVNGFAPVSEHEIERLIGLGPAPRG